MAKAALEIPNKLFFKIGEVCEITDTQPYVLRFWESEFPQLAPRKNRSGQRVYQRKDIETVLRIKKLLYEEEYTIAGARKKLDEDASGPRASQNGEEEAVPGAVARAAAPDRTAAHDHPVDVLTARSTRVTHGTRGTQEPEAAANPDRAARLDQVLAEIKQSLQEMLHLLQKD